MNIYNKPETKSAITSPCNPVKIALFIKNKISKMRISVYLSQLDISKKNLVKF